MECIMSNNERISRANAAFTSYDKAWGHPREASIEEMLIDLVTDLGHLARSESVDFGRVLRCAQTHLDEE